MMSKLNLKCKIRRVPLLFANLNQQFYGELEHVRLAGAALQDFTPGTNKMLPLLSRPAGFVFPFFSLLWAAQFSQLVGQRFSDIPVYLGDVLSPH